MGDVTMSGHCRGCGAPVEMPNKPDQVCPKCGCTKFDYQVTITEEVSAAASIGAKARHGQPGHVKPFLEHFQGQVRQHSGEFCEVERRADRDTDWYDEVVTNPDGIIKCETHEPLSEHRGHGSDKNRRE